MKAENYNKDTFPLQTFISSIIVAAAMTLLIVLVIELFMMISGRVAGW
jgi:hypothetical protein